MHIHIKISIVNPFGLFFQRNGGGTIAISDHQQSRGYALLVIADFINSIHKLLTLFSFRSISRDHPVTVESFQFLSRKINVALEGVNRGYMRHVE